MVLRLVTGPAGEPVSLDEAKAHLRVEIGDDDALITRLIAAARAAAEDFTGRAFVTQTWRLTLDRPPLRRSPWWDGVREGADTLPRANAIVLPRPPLQAVVKVETFDEAGDATVWDAANYVVDTEGARLVLRAGAAWPVPQRTSAGFAVTYTAGYGDQAEDVPSALRQGILAHVAALYEHRGDDRMPAQARALYAPFRMVAL